MPLAPPDVAAGAGSRAPVSLVRRVGRPPHPRPRAASCRKPAQPYANHPVYYLPQTGEIFPDYERYTERRLFYRQPIFMDRITGHRNVSLFTALELEDIAMAHLQSHFPQPLKRPVLRSLQDLLGMAPPTVPPQTPLPALPSPRSPVANDPPTQGPMDVPPPPAAGLPPLPAARVNSLAEAVHERFRHRFFENELVVVELPGGEQHAARIKHVFPPRGLLRKQHSMLEQARRQVPLHAPIPSPFSVPTGHFVHTVVSATLAPGQQIPIGPNAAVQGAGSPARVSNNMTDVIHVLGTFMALAPQVAKELDNDDDYLYGIQLRDPTGSGSASANGPGAVYTSSIMEVRAKQLRREPRSWSPSLVRRFIRAAAGRLTSSTPYIVPPPAGSEWSSNGAHAGAQADEHGKSNPLPKNIRWTDPAITAFDVDDADHGAPVPRRGVPVLLPPDEETSGTDEDDTRALALDYAMNRGRGRGRGRGRARGRARARGGGATPGLVLGGSEHPQLHTVPLHWFPYGIPLPPPPMERSETDAAAGAGALYDPTSPPVVGESDLSGSESGSSHDDAPMATNPRIQRRVAATLARKRKPLLPGEAPTSKRPRSESIKVETPAAGTTPVQQHPLASGRPLASGPNNGHAPPWSSLGTPAPALEHGSPALAPTPVPAHSTPARSPSPPPKPAPTPEEIRLAEVRSWSLQEEVRRMELRKTTKFPWEDLDLGMITGRELASKKTKEQLDRRADRPRPPVWSLLPPPQARERNRKEALKQGIDLEELFPPHAAKEENGEAETEAEGGLPMPGPLARLKSEMGETSSMEGSTDMASSMMDEDGDVSMTVSRVGTPAPPALTSGGAPASRDSSPVARMKVVDQHDMLTTLTPAEFEARIAVWHFLNTCGHLLHLSNFWFDDLDAVLRFGAPDSSDGPRPRQVPPLLVEIHAALLNCIIRDRGRLGKRVASSAKAAAQAAANAVANSLHPSAAPSSVDQTPDPPSPAAGRRGKSRVRQGSVGTDEEVDELGSDDEEGAAKVNGKDKGDESDSSPSVDDEAEDGDGEEDEEEVDEEEEEDGLTKLWEAAHTLAAPMGRPWDTSQLTYSSARSGWLHSLLDCLATYRPSDRPRAYDETDQHTSWEEILSVLTQGVDGETDPGRLTARLTAQEPPPPPPPPPPAPPSPPANKGKNARAPRAGRAKGKAGPPSKAPAPAALPLSAYLTERYLSLTTAQRLAVLEWLVELAVCTRSIRQFFEDCENNLTHLRKVKGEISRRRKLYNEHRTEFEAAVRARTKQEKGETSVPGTGANTPAASDDESDDGKDGKEGKDEQRKTRLAEVAAQAQRGQAEEQAKVEQREAEEKNKLADEWTELEREDNTASQAWRRSEHAARQTPLGYDRFHNAYWWFDGVASDAPKGYGRELTDLGYGQAEPDPDPDEEGSTSPAPRKRAHDEAQAPADQLCGVGRLYVQGAPVEAIEGMKAWADHPLRWGETKTRLQSESGSRGLLPPGQWAAYTAPRQVDELIAWLRVKGIRENALKAQLMRFKPLIEASMIRRARTLAYAAEHADPADDQDGDAGEGEKNPFAVPGLGPSPYPAPDALSIAALQKLYPEGVGARLWRYRNARHAEK